MNYYDFEALAKMKGLVKPGSIRELSDDRYRIFGLPINRWDGDTLVASAPKTKRYKNEASN